MGVKASIKHSAHIVIAQSGNTTLSIPLLSRYNLKNNN